MNSVRKGEGELTFINGDKYIGLWDRDQINGDGTYYYVNGDKYTGEFFKNKKHGKGVLHKNGDIYEGCFVNG